MKPTTEQIEEYVEALKRAVASHQAQREARHMSIGYEASVSYEELVRTEHYGQVCELHVLQWVLGNWDGQKVLIERLLKLFPKDTPVLGGDG